MKPENASGQAPTFTVFTPSYNRADTLPRVFASLCNQTYRDFEWLIIDDGSQDATESLVHGWQQTACFPIRYIWQPNAGKHIAFNHGVAEARGRLFLPLDSDNAYVPATLERFAFHWQAIPSDNQHEFTGVSALSQTVDGRLLGSPFPFDPTDSNALEIRLKYRVTGEKVGFHRVDVLRQFPFPQFPGETNLPDSLLWNRIARHYKTRYVNEPLQTYYFTPNGWLANLRRLVAKNPRGHRLYWREYLHNPYPIAFTDRLKGYIKYIRAAYLCGDSPAAQVRAVPSPVDWALAWPAGYLLFLRDRPTQAASGR